MYFKKSGPRRPALLKGDLKSTVVYDTLKGNIFHPTVEMKVDKTHKDFDVKSRCSSLGLLCHYLLLMF